MFDQKEYMLAYALTFGLVLLGMLFVCVPRPRKAEKLDPETAEKLKREKQKAKVAAKAKKKKDKIQKKKMKSKAKKKKKK